MTKDRANIVREMVQVQPHEYLAEFAKQFPTEYKCVVNSLQAAKMSEALQWMLADEESANSNSPTARTEVETPPPQPLPPEGDGEVDTETAPAA